MHTRIKNGRGLELDTLVGESDSDITVVFAHGYGTGKDEGFNLFLDLATELRETARTVRFDFSGYGQSQGREQDTTLDIMADDVRSVVAWTKERYPGRLMIIAHSMGTMAVALAAPEGIERSVFTGIPNPDAEESMRALQLRILQRGGTLDVDGITIYPRKDGRRQKIGPEYWVSYVAHDRLEIVRDYARKTELTIIKPLDDEVVGGPEVTKAYARLPGVTVCEMRGDHSFTRPKDRKALLRKIHELIAEPG